MSKLSTTNIFSMTILFEVFAFAFLLIKNSLSFSRNAKFRQKIFSENSGRILSFTIRTRSDFWSESSERIGSCSEQITPFHWEKSPDSPEPIPEKRFAKLIRKTKRSNKNCSSIMQWSSWISIPTITNFFGDPFWRKT